MAITNASRLADFGSGIGTAGAVLQIDNEKARDDDEGCEDDDFKFSFE